MHLLFAFIYNLSYNRENPIRCDWGKNYHNVYYDILCSSGILKDLYEYFKMVSLCVDELVDYGKHLQTSSDRAADDINKTNLNRGTRITVYSKVSRSRISIRIPKVTAVRTAITVQLIKPYLDSLLRCFYKIGDYWMLDYSLVISTIEPLISHNHVEM